MIINNDFNISLSFSFVDIGVDCTILNKAGNHAFLLIKNKNDRLKIEFLLTGIRYIYIYF